MDAIVLQDAFQRLMEAATHARFSPPTDSNQWSVELVLAHVIATNRTLIMVGTQILDGREATYEGGTISVNAHWLRSIVEASEDRDGLLTAFHQSSRELLTLTRSFDDDTANKMFPATIYDGHGRVLWDGPVSLGDLLTKKMVYHMAQHTRQIQALGSDNNQ